MSADDRFRDVDWEVLLYRLTVRARQLFAAAKAKGYGNALARTSVGPDDLAASVLEAALRNEEVKFKPSKGASLTTFLCRVLEADFKDLLRKGVRLNRRLVTLDESAVLDPECTPERGVLHDLDDGGQEASRIQLRAAALLHANGDRELEDYVSAAFDFGAVTRADQASLLQVEPSVVTNRRKKFLRLLASTAPAPPTNNGGEQ